MGIPRGRRSHATALVACAGAAFLIGAAGMMTQRLGLSALGLSLGAGLGATVGLALYMASWALGAWRAGRHLGPGNLFFVGGAAGLGAGLLAWTVGHGVLPNMACLLIAGFCQGCFLPLLVRRWRGEGIAALWGINLLGGMVGLVFWGEWAAARFGVMGLGASALLAGLSAGVLPSRISQAKDTGQLGANTGAGLLSQAGARSIIVTVTVLSIVSEGLLLRLAALDLGSMHAATSHALGGALLALALGAWILPRFVPQDRRGPLTCMGLGIVSMGLWFVPEFHAWVAALHGQGSLSLLAGALLAIPLLPLGAVVPTVHRALEGEGGRRLGDLLLPEALGALLALPLLWYGPGSLGLEGMLALCALLVGACAWFLGSRVIGGGAVAGALVLGSLPAPATQTPVYQRPEFQVISLAQDEHFNVAVVEDTLRGERTLMTDGFRATATGSDYHYMRALGHLPALLHPDPRRAAVLAFGTGTTAGALAMHPEVQELHILELSGAVIEQAKHFANVNHDVLQDPRVQLSVRDGRRSLGEFQGSLDLLTMEPLLPDAPGAVYLYTEEFYADARNALAPGGILCQWVPPHALRPATCRAVVGAFARSFPWSGIFQYGTQWILIGADSLPLLDPARFPQEGALKSALQPLGLDGPSGVAAHWWTLCPEPLDGARPLLDRDPWIVHARPPIGAEALSWLPVNMAWLRQNEVPLPLPWSVLLSAVDQQRVTALGSVRLGREMLSARQALLGGVGDLGTQVEVGELVQLQELVAAAKGLVTYDPEVVAFERELTFQTGFSLGLGYLATGNPLRARDLLLGAAEAKPQRSDAHLAFALAAEGLGAHGLAEAALGRALKQCPRILDSRSGKKITGLVPDDTQRLLRRVLDRAKPTP